MQNRTPPPAKFRRFEVVSVTGRRPGDVIAGQRGTIVWCDPPWLDRRTGAWVDWIYCIVFPKLDCYLSVSELNLESTGEFVAEQTQLGTRYELSFDTVAGEDMGVVEGAYRLPGQFWQVFLFLKRDVPELSHSFETWSSGITGVEVHLPHRTIVNHELVLAAMSDIFDGALWNIISGPDSLIFK